ncbi:helix-turn-helix domain-containing protein [Antrihabitans sp. YC2-6]|uniref:winged helix-turn-helix transcriptional regulator n=1 Tax=Antrihabitans sp. YC2-6 TaxID=2799498 RepID=UPI0018F5F177|nr:helix-turn-helix domain-containing protein [Antrihabitans sp. YC2-6]MBJ8344220.1 helix-turn-helix transcriptional regulator [Antrihabitans sp. YC2-6]
MRTREYGQFCGLARAAEVLGQRWTILIVRDLLVGPRRYSDLLAGLPGIPTNVLASRLKELEEDGLVVREARAGSDRSVVYRVTARAEELRTALDALGRWGAAGMREPREGEFVTDASLVGSLRVAGQGRTPPRRRQVTYEVRVGPAVVNATVARGEITVAPGPGSAPDLVISGGPGFRDVLAGVLDADAAVATGAVELSGDESLFADFQATFSVPYSATLAL